MTENAIAKPQDFESVVRDRIRKVIFDSVPDEQIDSLIKAQYERLFERRAKSYGGADPSVFETMVDGELQRWMKAKITELVESKMTGVWDQTTMSEIVMKDVVEKFSATALQAISGHIVTSALNNFRHNLSQVGNH